MHYRRFSAIYQGGHKAPIIITHHGSPKRAPASSCGTWNRSCSCAMEIVGSGLWLLVAGPDLLGQAPQPLLSSLESSICPALDARDLVKRRARSATVGRVIRATRRIPNARRHATVTESPVQSASCASRRFSLGARFFKNEAIALTNASSDLQNRLLKARCFPIAVRPRVAPEAEPSSGSDTR